MSKTLTRATALLFALALTAGLAACSGATDDPALAAQQAALEDYVAESQAQIPAIMEESGTTYSEIRISAVQPGTVEYAYVFTEAVDPDAAVTYFDENIGTLQDVCDSALFPEMAGYGITLDPIVRYAYYNADGSEIWAHDFSPS